MLNLILIAAIAGADKLLEEETKLASQYGQSDASSYVNMLDFAMADGWRLAGEAGLSMPPRR